jgi:hypothetical protein
LALAHFTDARTCARSARAHFFLAMLELGIKLACTADCTFTAPVWEFGRYRGPQGRAKSTLTPPLKESSATAMSLRPSSLKSSATAIEF